MDDQAGGLVEHDEIAVLVKDVQRDRLAFQGDRTSFGDDDGESLVGLHLGGGAEDRPAAAADVALLAERLEAAARELRLGIGQPAVAPAAGCRRRAGHLVASRTAMRRFGKTSGRSGSSWVAPYHSA